MNTFFLLILLFVPAVTHADDGMTLRDHAILRSVHRLGIGTHFGSRTHMIRLGHNVRTRRMSPRRVHASTEGTVVSVIDGSVMQVKLDAGTTETVRTLGAEAPVLHAGSEKLECYALNAKVALFDLLIGKRVSLERDRNYQRDREGRLLRYVRLNSLDVNAWMIDSGHSFSDARNGHRRQSDYHGRQAEAKEYERGLW